MIAIQGEPGSNSHMAAMQMVRSRSPEAMLELAPCRLSAEVVERLACGGVDCAVLPIENSLHGSVSEHYDLLLAHPVRIVTELELRIQHNVISAPGVRLEEVRRVLSHPVALSQCRRWLQDHPQIEAVPFYDTAGGVREVISQKWQDAAALAPQLAADVYGGAVLQAGVEDHPLNFTRFYQLVREADSGIQPIGLPNKLSVAFSLKHTPGSLLTAVDVFAASGMNLTRIESRPVPGRPWEYMFFVDARFTDQAQAEQLMVTLQHRCERVRELGRYLAARTGQ